MPKERIAIDMDEVIADAVQRFTEWYHRDFNVLLTPEHLHGKRLLEAVAPDHRKPLREYLDTVGFFQDLPVMPDSQAVLRQMADRYELFIATAAMGFPLSFGEKFEWLRTHFDFIPTSHVVFCGDKSILNADYLIDDNAYNFRDFRGEGILFTSHHNVHETQYRRVNNWKEVAEMFL
ncbi:5' nucleotidase, NT5C type [Hymenobacter jejuensis]|nr:5'(3')-deoxyribonucleotidase [Hymenobacter jejuensis]